ncbi:MAG: class II aldolase/adducin family protein [Candidatus Marinimicrobia bacterium]|nr:class II aldolase/adducin family protein [Candidatus Neomarinimicrobiota bacterium]
MTEGYRGPKFTTVWLERQVPEFPSFSELKHWCHQLAVHDLAPAKGSAYAGNASVRTGGGMVITAARTNLGRITPEELVEVLAVDTEKSEVIARGLREPSSESFLHYAIYQQRSDIHAILHGHDKVILSLSDRLSILTTVAEQPYGTLDLVEEVFRVMGNESYLLMKNHGFLSLGIDLEEAGREALRYHCKAVNLIQRPFN